MMDPLAPAVPAFALTLDGQPITDRFSPRLVSLTLTDKRGLEADELDIVLTDHDGLLALPPKGAKLTLALGWAGALIPRGTYLVDEVEHSGTPDQLHLRARSADLRGAFTVRRSQSYHDTTLGAIVDSIAGRAGLTGAVSEALASVAVKHLDQKDQSDADLLTDLSETHDAIAAVKDGRLLFGLKGQGLTISGKALPAIVLTRADGDQHRYSLTAPDAYTGVDAQWKDLGKGKTKTVQVGDAENSKRLKGTYPSETDALTAARSAWARIQRGGAELSFTLARGRADLAPETPITLIGIKPQIDQARWIVTEATHSLSDAGYTTSFTAELAGG